MFAKFNNNSILKTRSNSLFNCVFQDWNRESTPLKPQGKIAKFPSKPLDKFSGTEKDNIFVQLEVEGDPIPKFEFFKVCKQARIVDHFNLRGYCYPPASVESREVGNLTERKIHIYMVSKNLSVHL